MSFCCCTWQKSSTVRKFKPQTFSSFAFVLISDLSLCVAYRISCFYIVPVHSCMPFCVPFALLLFCCSVSYLMVLDKGFCLIRQSKTCTLFCLPFDSWVCDEMGLDTLKTLHHFREYLSRGAAVRSSHQICMCAPHRHSVWAFEQGCNGIGGLVQAGSFLSFAYFLLLLYLLSSIGMTPLLLLSTSLVSSRESVSPDWHVKRFLNKQH